MIITITDIDVDDEFSDEMIEKIEGLSLFHYINSLYLPVRKLKKRIENYILKILLHFIMLINNIK